MRLPPRKDANPRYWQEYTNLQRVKHSLIEKYLSGWLPMLGSWSGRILYFDTHAGRGKHAGGQYGSPLIALNTLLEHRFRENLLGKCEVVFFFIEIDKENCETLECEIDSLGELPKQIKVKVIPEDCFSTLRSIVDDLNDSGSRLAPAFIFVDPYGFKVPAGILRDLMDFERVELFVNIIWRELSMAIAQGETNLGMAETLSLIYDGEDWKELIDLEFEEQADKSVNLLRNKIGARWSTYIRMLGKNRATRYMLLHLTNHAAGRDLMKECIWKACPEGGFLVRVTDNPAQQYLVTPTPDLTPLRKWVVDKLSIRSSRWQDLMEDLRAEIWRKVQLNEVIRGLRKERVLDGRKYENQRRFVPKQNPELYLLKSGEKRKS